MVKLQITSGCIELSTPFVNEIKAFLKEVHDAFAEEFKNLYDCKDFKLILSLLVHSYSYEP